jgi:hypothetical protein
VPILSDLVASLRFLLALTLVPLFVWEIKFVVCLGLILGLCASLLDYRAIGYGITWFLILDVLADCCGDFGIGFELYLVLSLIVYSICEALCLTVMVPCCSVG